MRNIHKYFAVAVLVVAAAESSAQDLDPTVVVDRAYEGKLVEVHKPTLEMAVPDTVLRFDLDFDYSVFDSPYKGSYEFKPYLLSMRPAASADGSHKFYLRAGAGYSLHPELDMVWAPDLKTDDFAMDVFASHRSYFGKYHDLDGQNGGEPWKGSDLKSTVGLAGHGDWDSGSADFGFSYSNLTVKEMMRTRSYNAMDVTVSLGSKDASTSVDYKIDARYRMGNDGVSEDVSGNTALKENVLDVDAYVGFPLRGSVLLFDLDADFATYGGQYKATAGKFGITPHYVYRRQFFMADLGLRLEKILGNDADPSSTTAPVQQVYTGYGHGQIVYPDVTVELSIIRKALRFKIHVGGGGELDTYESVLERNHHAFGYIPDCSVDRFNATAGFEGSIASRFSYSIYGGYANCAHGLLDAVYAGEKDGKKILAAGLGHASYKKWIAGADFLWKNEELMIDGTVLYTSADGDAFAGDFLKPAALSGDMAVEYNWKRRIIGGVDCRFATAREGAAYTMPGYADLGLYAEYATSGGLSFWARGGNLLGMTVQHAPLYAEKGAYFTLGICLKL